MSAARSRPLVSLIGSSHASPDVREIALAVHEASAAADGTPPFDERTLLGLTPGWEPEAGTYQHVAVTTRVGREPLGYGRLDIPADHPGQAAPASAEFAIHPRFRGQGRGLDMLRELAGLLQSRALDGRRLPGGDLEREEDWQQAWHQDHPALLVWSHGDQPGARALAARTGFHVVRELIQMRRPLGGGDGGGELAEPRLGDGVTIRAFRPGADDADWLRLNAAAFARHPEQGRMTQADLSARMAEDWFDPAGFLIAEQDGAMIGFHWTKVHPADEDPDGQALGEVYVVGVDPARHGGGLGSALTVAGLRYLRDRGLGTVLLYVESDNGPALAVYRRLEFRPWRTDVMYQSPEHSTLLHPSAYS